MNAGSLTTEIEGILAKERQAAVALFEYEFLLGYIHCEPNEYYKEQLLAALERLDTGKPGGAALEMTDGI